MSESNLYIVDNSDETKSVKRYLAEWCPISKQLDVATGYLEIGGLLTLDTQWQKLDKVRIILGNEMTKRTEAVLQKAADFFVSAMRKSLDAAQEKDDFLVGVPAILAALKSRKIECRVYESAKFHAKAYITKFRDDYRAKFPASMHVPSGYALVGSSNFTAAGLTKNIELNVQLKDNVDELQEWFEKQWNDAADITDAILKVIESHCREYSPYDVYLRSMYEFFKSKESVSEWEQKDSKVYPILSQYQRDGYNNLVDIASKYSGAFLCDGVGLGKTYEGLMLIERFVKHERRKTVLIVPAAARESVWETAIGKYMPDILDGFSPFKIINHTDLLLEKNQFLMQQIASQAEIVIIDEAHHFRTKSSSRYKKLMEIMKTAPRKRLFMLTATPVNNSLRDLQHMIELFTLQDDAFFSGTSLGIHSLVGHFKKMEAKLNELTYTEDYGAGMELPESIFTSNPLISALVVQRSRSFVKKSLAAQGGGVLFPKEKKPSVANYSLKSSYGRLTGDFLETCSRHDRNGRPTPILALAIYSPYEEAYFLGDLETVDKMKVGRQRQIVSLVRLLLLKRFESSVAAFQDTCIRIYARLKKFVVDYRDKSEHAVDRLFSEQADIVEYVEDYIKAHTKEGTVEDFEDDLPDYVWETEEDLTEENFNLPNMVLDTVMDLQTLGTFIKDMADLDSAKDDKLNTLKKLLKSDPRIAGRKVIIFSEYRSTAKYLEKELKADGFKGVFEIDGQSKVDRHEMIQRFAPYYNDTTSGEVSDEIKILIATDVLSEGLNLQDAGLLINYEIHWNPVRLMQRIGRVDRRRSAAIEEKMIADHPDLAAGRDTVHYWNFLPPDELDSLLGLYGTVATKTLRISKMFGIEGKKLLTEDDDYDALGDFNAQYEGHTTPTEEVSLAYLELLKANPGYLEDVKNLPEKMYSGKSASSAKGYFFCYALPTKMPDSSWSMENADYRWLVYDPADESVCTQVKSIWEAIRCEKSTPRVLVATAADFAAVRRKVEAHLRNTYFKAACAPLGVGPRLVTWMQLV